MKFHRFRNAAVLGFIFGSVAASLQAQPDIVWQTPMTIAGTSDVSTQGTYFGSWAPQDGSANTLPVNGVTFQGFSDLPLLTPASVFDSGYNGFGSPNTTDANYNTLLQSGRYAGQGGVQGTITWSGMIPGHAYIVQFWVNDGRNIGESRSETITGGNNTSDALSFGSDGSGPGQFIIGTFIADDSGSETLTLTPYSTGSNPDIQVNLLQVRDVTTNYSPSVTWQAPMTISGTSDVSTQGTYFGSWAPQDGSANTLPVNGVTFQGFSDLPNFAPGATWDNGYNGFGDPNTGDPNYNALLQYARFSNEQNTPATITWGGMTPGDTYLVQFWVNDGRSIGQTRSETITGGTNTSAPLFYGSDGSGPGEDIIGTFVADGTGTQTLVLTAYSSGNAPDPQVNLLQVRDVTGTVVPPAAPVITGIALSGTTLTLGAKNGVANGQYILLESSSITAPLSTWTPILTNSFDATGAASLTTAVNGGGQQEFFVLKTAH